MTTVSKGTYSNFLDDKHASEGFKTPVSLGSISVTVENRLDLLGDFNEFMTGWKKKQEEEYRRRCAEWQRDVYRAFGCIPYYDDPYWDEDEDFYDDWGVGYIPRTKPNNVDHRTHNQKMIDKYGNPQSKNKNNKGFVKQKFINGIEVDPNISEEEAYQLYIRTANNKDTDKTRKKHNKRGGSKKRRYEGGTTSRTFQDGYDEPDEWFGDDTVIDPDPDGDFQFERYQDNSMDDLDAKKRIVFYRHLNNTADTYEFESAAELSDWVQENDIHVSDDDGYGIVYADETHCALDPQADRPTLVCAANYEDLVYFITGGDAVYLAEVSARNCPY